MVQREEVLLLLGGDRGELPNTLRLATERIGERAGEVLAISRDHWSEAWGFVDDALFLNRALLIRTVHAPHQLLNILLGVEQELGRERETSGAPGPRTIDIDILLYGERVITEPGLIIPHPRMAMRRFALAPAADVAPDMRHPVFGRSIIALLEDLRRSTEPAKEEVSA